MHPASVLIFLPVLAAAQGAACSGDGGSGTCINKDKQSCSGILVANQCAGPANVRHQVVSLCATPLCIAY